MSRLEDPYHSDTYHELASIRANTQASVAFQALQTGLLAQMSGSMDGIHAEMAHARQQQSEALAIQQELLNREQIQSHLEEFIFQAEKLVAECSKTTTDIPASSRYFLLKGVLGKIKEDGIGTPIIKGRDNKSAFEKVIQDTKDLTQKLLSHPDVQEALEWAEAERLRKEEEQKRLTARRKQEQQKRDEMIAKLEKQLGPLQARLQKVPVSAVWKDWSKQIKGTLPVPEAFKTPLFITMCVLGVLAYPVALGVWFFAWRASVDRSNEINKDINDEVARINIEIADLKGQS